MKKLKTLALAALLLHSASAPSASRADDDLGIGVILGSPSGLTFKSWQSRSRAIDGGVAYAFNNFLHVYLDYLFHAHASDLIKENTPFVTTLRPYAGIGALATLGGSFSAGARIPLGLEWKLANPPLGFFLEAVPELLVFPATASAVSGGIGARYYF